jgi:hypothetical protein
MNVFDSQNIYFVEFLKKLDELSVRFNIEDVLKIYFDLKTRMNVENWIVVMIESLSCASQKDVCISLFKKRDTKTNQYDDRDLNSLSINIIEITKTFEQIFRHFAHSIAIDYDFRDKIFRRQIIDLHKLYFNEECRWWKEHLFDKNMRSSFHADVYERCHFTIISLLNVAHFNEAQRRNVNHVKRFLNEIDLIIESTTTRKITFVIIIVQLFLWTSSSNRSFQNAFEIVNNSTNIALDTNFTFAEKNKVVQKSTKITLDLDFTFAENAQIVQNSTKTISNIDITFAKNITVVQTSTKIALDVDRTLANNLTIVRSSNVLICTSNNSTVDDIADQLYR